MPVRMVIIKLYMSQTIHKNSGRGKTLKLIL